ncbi:hypothetical protein D9M70_317390 [compost metagenome]
MLEVFPGALDGVDDHGARVTMLRQRDARRCLEQGDGFAADRIAFDVFEEYIIAVGGEGNPGQVFVIDSRGVDRFVKHGIAPLRKRDVGSKRFRRFC